MTESERPCLRILAQWAQDCYIIMEEILAISLRLFGIFPSVFPSFGPGDRKWGFAYDD